MPDTFEYRSSGRATRTAKGDGTRSGSGPELETADPLDELSAVSDTYVRRSIPKSRQRQRISFLFPVLAAIAVGFGLLIAGRNEYLCGATFRIDDKLDASLRDRCRDTLHDVVSADFVSPLDASGEQKYVVDYVAPDRLRFGFVTPDLPGVERKAKDISAAFLTKLRANLSAERQRPTQGELALTRHIETLTQTLSAEQNRLQKALAGVPAENYQARRDALLDQWKAMRAKYSNEQDKLGAARGSVSQLRSSPPVSHGIVSSQDRRAAFDHDLGLQQDLKELTVALTEVRGSLKRLNSTMAPLRSQLETAAAKLQETISEGTIDSCPDAVRKLISVLEQDATAFTKALTNFSQAWDDGLSAISELNIDPESHELLDRYDHIQTSLNLFLFDTSKALTGLRDSAGKVAETKSEDASLIKFQLALSRDFQALQTIYHRFEFSAGKIDRTQNFRLDAALRSASGLQKRSQQRMRNIDADLQKVALKQMKEQQAKSLRQAEERLEHARAQNDETVTGLIELQDQLSSHVDTTEAFVAASVRAETTARAVDSLKKAVGEAKQRLVELEQRRTQYGRDLTIELEKAGILGPPINVGQRLRHGALGVSLTFFALLLGQWWITRRT